MSDYKFDAGEYEDFCQTIQGYLSEGYDFDDYPKLYSRSHGLGLPPSYFEEALENHATLQETQRAGLHVWVNDPSGRRDLRWGDIGKFAADTSPTAKSVWQRPRSDGKYLVVCRSMLNEYADSIFGGSSLGPSKPSEGLKVSTNASHRQVSSSSPPHRPQHHAPVFEFVSSAYTNMLDVQASSCSPTHGPQHQNPVSVSEDLTNTPDDVQASAPSSGHFHDLQSESAPFSNAEDQRQRAAPHAAWLAWFDNVAKSHNVLCYNSEQCSKFLGLISDKSLAIVDAEMRYEPGTSLSLLRWNPDTRHLWENNSAIVVKDKKALKSFFDLLTSLDSAEDKSYDAILATRQTNDPEELSDGILRKHQNELIGQIYPDSMHKALEVLYPGAASSNTRGRIEAKVHLGKARLGAKLQAQISLTPVDELEAMISGGDSHRPHDDGSMSFYMS